ncbi:MAG: hypothetical protein MUE58_03575 [Chitinophagaceae bacterium]|nr:hypothetical protein [Chitinophagaceae bacterium]
MNRKLLCIVLSVFMISIAHAQVKKGSWLLGGQLSFGANKTTSGSSEQKNNGTYIQLSAGKAIRDNRVWGGQVSAGFSTQDFSNGTETGTQQSQDYSAGVFYRLYKNLGKDFFFFGQANADFRWGQGEAEFPNSADNRESTSIGGSVSVTPGIAYALFPRFHVELTLPGLFGIGYNQSTTTYANGQTPELKSSSFNAFTSVGNNGQAGLLGVGFRLLL